MRIFDSLHVVRFVTSGYPEGKACAVVHAENVPKESKIAKSDIPERIVRMVKALLDK